MTRTQSHYSQIYIASDLLRRGDLVIFFFTDVQSTKLRFLRRDKTEKLKAGKRFNLRIANLSFGNNRFFPRSK